MSRRRARLIGGGNHSSDEEEEEEALNQPTTPPESENESQHSNTTSSIAAPLSEVDMNEYLFHDERLPEITGTPTTIHVQDTRLHLSHMRMRCADMLQKLTDPKQSEGSSLQTHRTTYMRLQQIVGLLRSSQDLIPHLSSQLETFQNMLEERENTPLAPEQTPLTWTNVLNFLRYNSINIRILRQIVNLYLIRNNSTSNDDIASFIQTLLSGEETYNPIGSDINAKISSDQERINMQNYPGFNTLLDYISVNSHGEEVLSLTSLGRRNSGSSNVATVSRDTGSPRVIRGDTTRPTRTRDIVAPPLTVEQQRAAGLTSSSAVYTQSAADLIASLVSQSTVDLTRSHAPSSSSRGTAKGTTKSGKTKQSSGKESIQKRKQPSSGTTRREESATTRTRTQLSFSFLRLRDPDVDTTYSGHIPSIDINDFEERALHSRTCLPFVNKPKQNVIMHGWSYYQLIELDWYNIPALLLYWYPAPNWVYGDNERVEEHKQWVLKYIELMALTFFYAPMGSADDHEAFDGLRAQRTRDRKTYTTAHGTLIRKAGQILDGQMQEAQRDARFNGLRCI